jgi:ATP-binding cassette, subfamily C (CFTR/MRP), member 1
MEPSSSFISRITFSWLFPLLSLGAKRPLEHTDLPLLLSADESQASANKFESLFKNAAKFNTDLSSLPIQKLTRTRLLSALFWSEPFMMSCAGINMLIGALLGFVGPLALEGIVNYVNLKSRGQNDLLWGFSNAQLELGQWWVIAMIVSSLLQNLCLHQHHHLSMRAAMRIKSAITVLVYRKSIKISPQSRNKFGIGMINNLAQQDANTISLVFWFIHYSWNAPMQLCLCLYLLYRQIGVGAFVALATLILSVPIQGNLAKATSTLQKESGKYSDRRVKFINEVFSGIRIIKFMNWENTFLEKILEARVLELDTKRKIALMSAAMSTLMMASPILVALNSFAVSSGTGVTLTPSTAFSSLTLFNILRLPLMILPMLLGSLAAANASLDRLATFISSDDMVDYRDEMICSEKKEYAAEFNNATLAWMRKSIDNDESDNIRAVTTNPTQTKSTETSTTSSSSSSSINNKDKDSEIEKLPPAASLHAINLTIPKGKLTVVMGAVGSGKSSLLSALLGEMEKWEGRVSLSESKSSIAYAAQQPFILNDSVRNNILFGLDIDEERYNDVLDACALRPDLLVLPSGDATEIGERGVNLSGGQKARVSLARAIYSKCTMVLLDDPLSAVDAHVAKHLVDNVLKGNLLTGRSIVLVTHQVALAAPIADYIVVMDAGRIAQVGTFSSLNSSSSSGTETLFSSMLHVATSKTSAVQKPDQDVEKEDEDEKGKPKDVITSLPKTTTNVSISVTVNPLEDKKKVSSTPGAKIITDEDRLRGGVPLKVYGIYLTSLGSFALVLIILSLAAVNVGGVGTDWFLGLWSTDSLSKPVGFYIGIYAAIIGGTILVSLICNIAWAYGGITAASSFHHQMLKRVLRAPSSFFDTTPLGRILNRFSTDVATVDATLPGSFSSYVSMASRILSTVIVQAIILPFTLIGSIPIGFCYAIVQSFYRNSSRELKRLDATSKSPIYAHISETLSGLTTIRAYGSETRFQVTCEKRIDTNNQAVFIANMINRWLGLRLDWIGAFLVGATGIVAVLTAGQISAGLIGLAISYALSVTGMLNWMVRGSTETETHLASVERIQHYSTIPIERPAIIDTHRPSQDWPQNGSISFKNLTARYRPELEPVLKDITFDVKPGSKIGVCGRTGSGKSSLMLTLFRILEADSGSIIIDDVDISTIGLDDLRSKLAIIPQDPTLFAGSLRYNLDPLDQCTDEELTLALNKIEGLKTAADTLGGLTGKVTEGGENLSVGQRQLVCLCRALLRQAKVLILDEATASVDSKTDEMIQKLLRSDDFKNTTVLVIAHRINTISDCDSVLVLEQGKVLEFGNPKQLIKIEGGAFKSLVERSEGNNNKK